MGVLGLRCGIIALALLSHSYIMNGQAAYTMNHPLEIHVRDRDGAPIKGAMVLVRPEESSEGIAASYDAGGVYYSNIAHERSLIIEIRHPEYEPQERRIRIESAHTRATFILGRPGDTYAYISNIMMPYTPMPDVLGFIATHITAEETGLEKNIRSELVTTLGLDPQSIQLLNGGRWPVASPYGIIRIKAPESAAELKEIRARLLEQLRASDIITSAGPVLMIEEHSNGAGTMLQLFTNRINVGFHPSVKDEDARKLIEAAGLRVTGFSGASMAYETVAAASTDEEINQLARQLREQKTVYWADVITTDIIPKGW